MGISFLSTRLNLIPTHHDSLLSQLTRAVTGGGFIYYWVQIFTMLILVLAANTGYQDFPRLGYFLARDKFMPRWMTNQGDRLVFNGGIITLAVLSSIVVIIFQADEFAMLPLYAIGVMLSFTISQTGMVKLMTKVSKLKVGETLDTLETHLHHEKGWQWKRIVNALGALTTAIVFVVLVITKFAEGAWIIVLVIPLIITMFYKIHQHYNNVAGWLSTRTLKEREISEIADVVILPIGDVHRGTIRALQFAQKISSDVRAVYISTDSSLKERFLARWKKFSSLTEKVNLIGIDYDYRDFLTPLIEYIERVNYEEFPNLSITVIIPEILTNSLITSTLHNKTALLLRNRLRQNLDIIIIEIPLHILPAEKKEEFKLSDENPAPRVDDELATDK